MCSNKEKKASSISLYLCICIPFFVFTGDWFGDHLSLWLLLSWSVEHSGCHGCHLCLSGVCFHVSISIVIPVFHYSVDEPVCVADNATAAAAVSSLSCNIVIHSYCTYEYRCYRLRWDFLKKTTCSLAYLLFIMGKYVCLKLHCIQSPLISPSALECFVFFAPEHLGEASCTTTTTTTISLTNIILFSLSSSSYCGHPGQKGNVKHTSSSIYCYITLFSLYITPFSFYHLIPFKRSIIHKHIFFFTIQEKKRFFKKPYYFVCYSLKRIEHQLFSSWRLFRCTQLFTFRMFFVYGGKYCDVEWTLRRIYYYSSGTM